MKGADRVALFCILVSAGAGECATPVAPAPGMPLAGLPNWCAPDIHPATLAGLIATESMFNPYAIGVVGGKSSRAAKTLKEAVATAKLLERQGANFSVGLTQINRFNLAMVGETYETIFEPCRNIRAGGFILKDCYRRAIDRFSNEQQALRAAFSCYYSGNFTRGFRPDSQGKRSYVQKVVANAMNRRTEKWAVPAVTELPPDNDAQAPSARVHSAASDTPSRQQKPAWGKYSDTRFNADERQPVNAVLRHTTYPDQPDDW